MKPQRDHRQQGWKGAIHHIINEDLKKWANQEKHLQLAYPTLLGYYPKAHHHYAQRQQGIHESILIYCHQGRGEVWIREEHHILRANQCILIPQNTPHAYGAYHSDPWTIEWSHIRGQLPKILPIFSKNSQRILSIERKSSIAHQFRELITSTQHQDRKQYQYSCLLLQKLLLSLNIEISKSNMEQHLFQEDLDYMKNHLHRQIQITELAQRHNWSISHYTREFKKLLGHAPLETFNQLKMQKASLLLSTTTLSILQISEELGYHDPAYFCRVFKKNQGVSPLQYRKKQGERKD